MIDHSRTYTELKLKNLPHRRRLADIRTIIRSLKLPGGGSYADIGCSNGFLTRLIADDVGAGDVWGFDHETENLDLALQTYPGIHFRQVDLNQKQAIGRTFDFVSCFETLEHVGNCEAAITNIIGALNDGGAAVISVPIEIGAAGLFKFLVKTAVYRYGLEELPGQKLFMPYLRTLLSGARIDRFRDRRDGWGTHFGFDYRAIDESLTRHGIDFRAFNRLFTRFYIIGPRYQASASASGAS